MFLDYQANNSTKGVLPPTWEQGWMLGTATMSSSFLLFVSSPLFPQSSFRDAGSSRKMASIFCEFRLKSCVLLDLTVLR